MTKNRSLLRSRVARRVVLLFVGCALIPLAALALVTRHAVQGQLEQQYGVRLRGDAKSAALGMFERLGLADAELEVVARALWQLPRHPNGTPRIPADLAPRLEVLLWQDEATGQVITLRGHRGSGALARLAATAAGPVEGRLHVQQADAGKRLVLLKTVHDGSRTGTLAAELDPSPALDLGADSLRPPSTEACVLDEAGKVIGCSSGVAADDAATVARVCRESTTAHRMMRADDHLYVACWSVPLRTQFGVPYWTVAIVVERDDVLAPTASFGRSFLAVLLLSLLIVVLLSLSTIRHNLRPLEELKEGVERVAARDFRTPVAVTSQDEFQEVAEAFNTMMTTLEATFAELDALHMGTLRALALAIDAKSSWTAGHSNRVTELALEIGREMGLPEADLKDLEVGGLLHDIGKLGVPGRILDKPGPLTPEEVAVMRQHPQLGAQILAPIPSTRRVLPIVLQHHERYDGRGYPAGLAGDDITLAARIFAVADVFDALHSTRPYRASMPAPVAVERVKAESGQHFDPRVVAAFLAVMTRRQADGSGPRTMPEPRAVA